MVAPAARLPAGTKARVYRPRGAAWSLFDLVLRATARPGERERWGGDEHAGPLWFATHHSGEVMLDGPAGTGKTFGLGHLFTFLAQNFPGSRGLLFRQTRKSLTDSALVTLEEKVWWPGHPMLHGSSARRGHRHSYRHPNGSEIVLAGADTPSKVLSTEWDWIWANEGVELSEEFWETATTRLRNGAIRPCPDEPPVHFAFLDTNPADEFHWLNQRPNEPHPDAAEPGEPLVVRSPRDVEAGSWSGVGVKIRKAPGTKRMQRLVSRHEDNPAIDPVYLSKLRGLKGKLRDRFYLGLWTSAEGQVWDNWRPAVHLIEAERDGRSLLPAFRWHAGSVDWGYQDPFVAEVWGVVGTGVDQIGYRICEVYQTQMTIDDAAACLVALAWEFGLARIVVDPSRPELIEELNRRMCPDWRKNPDAQPLAYKADNAIEVGVDTVRDALGDPEAWDGRPGTPGAPRLLFVRDALRYWDRDLHVLRVRDATGTPRQLTEWDAALEFFEHRVIDGERRMERAVRWNPTLGAVVDPAAEGVLVFVERGGFVEGKADPRRVEAKLPTCFEQEVGSYVYPKGKDGKPLPKGRREKPDPDCEDHGCDAVRYGARLLFERDMGEAAPPKRYEDGTFGAIMDLDEVPVHFVE